VSLSSSYNLHYRTRRASQTLYLSVYWNLSVASSSSDTIFKGCLQALPEELPGIYDVASKRIQRDRSAIAWHFPRSQSTLCSFYRSFDARYQSAPSRFYRFFDPRYQSAPSRFYRSFLQCRRGGWGGGVSAGWSFPTGEKKKRTRKGTKGSSWKMERSGATLWGNRCKSSQILHVQVTEVPHGILKNNVLFCLTSRLQGQFRH